MAQQRWADAALAVAFEELEPVSAFLVVPGQRWGQAGGGRPRPAGMWPHADLGIRLPPDYRTIVDAYAPIQLNGHLYLLHPATERWDLVQWIRDTAQAWSEVPWDELDLDEDEDPRQLLGLEELNFGTRNGLWPIASTDRGETVFLDTAADATRLVVNYDETWAEHRMSFAE